MKRTRRLAWLTFALVVLFTLAYRSAYVADETEFAVVTEFGRVVSVAGDDRGESGLHAKWPWQSVLKVDRRLRVFDPPAREVLTGDKRNLDVASYVVWRVSDPDRFLRSAGTPESAEARLSERVAAALGDALGRRDLSALASTLPNVADPDALTGQVLGAVGPQAERELGVTVVDVRLRRFNHPVEVRPAVFDLIRSERKRVAASLRAEGEAEYLSLTSQADRQRDTTLAQADAEAERLRGQADAEATRLANDAHARDPKFSEFLQTLDTYKALLDDKATVVLSASSPLLKLLTQGPGDDLMAPTPKPRTQP